MGDTTKRKSRITLFADDSTIYHFTYIYFIRVYSKMVSNVTYTYNIYIYTYNIYIYEMRNKGKRFRNEAVSDVLR